MLFRSGKGLDFRFECLDPLPEVVHADERRLRQILINLLANAVKFTDAGHVTLRVSYRREIARFVIEDTGIGIGPDDLERIFMPFERSGSASARSDIGTGLGLAITKLLTELMGGEVTVSSQPGHGSRFEIRMYLSRVASPKTTPRKEADIAGYHGAVRRILVVDDQATQREVLVQMLLPLGFDVQEAASGEACLAAVAQVAPDAVLLDIAMPGIDGWDTSRALRRDGAKFPVVMVSANAFENDPDKIAAAGCSDFIVKPVLVSELLAKLEWHLDLHWIYRNEAPVPVLARPQIPVTLPPAEHLDELLELGSIGYVKGIHVKLNEIEALDQRYAPFADDLRELVKHFRLDEYSRRLRAHADGRARVA